ncbi:MAG: Rne/Rng family ribonuclease [Fusobacteria bacterium]|nr:Rne/Rng family ribonuclease [Fusobacteriota bacterium]
MKQIIVNVTKLDIKVAIIESGKVVEFFIQNEDVARIIGNIYIGKVANVLPGMESAFLDIGLEKNAFLYVKDLREFEEKYLDGIENSEKPIEEILNVGDEVIVQVLKEPNGTKGARVTTHYTIPGKYLVLMPNNDYIAVSKKITDSYEKDRLKKILEDIKPKGTGLIIRTAARNKEESVFVKEIEYLVKKWKKIESDIFSSKPGSIVYKDTNVIRRVFRDMFSSEVDELIIDSEEHYWELIDYVSAFSENDLKLKLKLYQKSEPILEYYGIEKEVHKALQKKVWLDCGGYLIIEKTEALISIDVNTGKNTGCCNLDKTIFETNYEAALEIPKQLRLRNLGGIIIIDFIDMNSEEDKEKIIEALKFNLENDRIKTNIIGFTELGLVEMTRKRVGRQLQAYFLDRCNECAGSGYIYSLDTIIYNMIKEIQSFFHEKDIRGLNIKVSDVLYDKIEKDYIEYIKVFGKENGKDIKFKKESSYKREEIEIILIK